MAEERRFPCTQCKTEVVTTEPVGEILNKNMNSVMVLQHPDPIVCTGCGQRFLFVLVGITGMQFAWKEDETQKKKEEGVIEIPQLSTPDFDKLKGRKN